MKKLLFGVLFLFLASVSYAGIESVSPSMAGSGETLTIADTAVGFTAGNISVVSSDGTVKAGRAVFVLEGGDCRFTVDGTTPSTTVGTLVKAGSSVEITGVTNIANFRAIRTGSTSGTAYVSYYRDNNTLGDIDVSNGGATPTGAVTVVQGTGTNLHVVVDSGTITTVTNAVTVAQPTAASLNATVVLAPTTTMNHAQVSIPTTAGGTLLIATNASRKSLMIQNIGSYAMFCGNTGLSATTGFKVDIGASFFDDTAVFNGAVYCIGSGGTTTAAYREVQ